MPAISTDTHTDVIVIGAGAAGLMCAIEAGKRGRRVIVLEHANTVGKKIRISGGGRCNFTNVQADASAFISGNPHFCKSALARYTPSDFITLVEQHGIAYHEKTLGQLFCDDSAQQIIDMLLKECSAAGVRIETGCTVKFAGKEGRFRCDTTRGTFTSDSLVIASGGLSLPKIGATDFGFRLAKRFGLALTETRPGLVPLLWNNSDRAVFSELSGISLRVLAAAGNTAFEEDMLFTHRGLSGPAILQCSSYWRPGEPVVINCHPGPGPDEAIEEERTRNVMPANLLSRFLPKRFAQLWCERYSLNRPLSQLSNAELEQMLDGLHFWVIHPSGTEGYEKAEVTVGGIDTNELSSKTMEARRVPGLYCIGEVVDVTGHLGGYNFQWAWSSGFAAGQYV